LFDTFIVTGLIFIRLEKTRNVLKDCFLKLEFVCFAVDGNPKVHLNMKMNYVNTCIDFQIVIRKENVLNS